MLYPSQIRTAPSRSSFRLAVGAETRVDERSRITYRMEITGPAAETVGPEIGPEISGDFPEVLAALAARAEGLA